MDFNGHLVAKGSSSHPELSNLAAGTDTGGDGENTKGTLTFPNGVKIQWDTVALISDSQVEHALPEAYTGAQLFVYCSYGGDVSDTADESSLSALLPAVNTLSHVALKNNNSATRSVTFISIGFDL